jgi:hypothetical protein
MIDSLALIPIRAGTKKPVLPSWNLEENCVINHIDYCNLTGHDVAIAHAYCKPPTCCLDIDNVRASLPFLKALGFDPETAETTTYRSGRTNSVKLLFLLDEPLETHQEMAFGSVIHELRCSNANGTTAADVIPPSLHPSGTVYAYDNDLDLTAIKPLPRVLLQYWRERIADKKTAKQATTLTSKSRYVMDSPREVALIRGKLDYISPDCDRETWLKVVFSILAHDINDSIVIAEEWSCASSKFNRRDFDAAVSSYRPNGGIGIGTLHYYAVQGGYLG